MSKLVNSSLKRRLLIAAKRPSNPDADVCREAAAALSAPEGMPEEAELEWLHRFLNCTVFGPPPGEIQRAHRIVDALRAHALRRDEVVKRLQEEIEALTHEGRQGELEQANVGLADENERFREGLRWYAEGNHFELPKWDGCSGESANWLFPPPETTEECWMVDDGGIAQNILDGHRINPDPDADEITLPPADAARRG